ncbi:GDP-Man:Man(3)GlcNAc(2)-PP-Dol alpha-1,2-mannosyltransferase [Hydra vulgaris]|nr:GDP-Man:Man(3)GlcNAc(2)-PP-Dol alpha-1,2-mannosyltransferase [Hydra vulgaris]
MQLIQDLSFFKMSVIYLYDLIYFLMSTLMSLCFFALSALICIIILLKTYILLSKWHYKLNNKNKNDSIEITVGFFHPYCNAGGGGERVLWCAIRALQNRYSFVKCVVYTGDIDSKPEDILKRAKERFNIEINSHVHFVYLHKRVWVTAELYPVLTLLGQSLGSIVLGFEALFKFTPNIYLDTMGYAFTIPIFKYIGGCYVGSYVHYPTISTDMLEKVLQRQADYNNSLLISKSYILSTLKWIYYNIFALCYGLSGCCNDIVMVNSSWTLNHIISLWKVPQITSVIFPPCDTKTLMNISIDASETLKVKPKQIISVAQFRPEKNHMLQLEIFEKFLKQQSYEMKNCYRLLLVGSCRGEEDNNRVELLKKKAELLKINQQVEFHLNISHEKLLNLLTVSTIGLHTMKDEHFGIGVVEFMAAGLIVLAHNSAGPKMDIVINWNSNETGYLASTAEEYVEALSQIFNLLPSERYHICMNARDSVKKRFSEETFEKLFLAKTEFMFTKH